MCNLRQRVTTAATQSRNTDVPEIKRRLRANLLDVSIFSLTAFTIGFKSRRAGTQTDTLIIALLPYYTVHPRPQYVTRVQLLHFKGGFNAWLAIDSVLGSRAGFTLLIQAGRGKK